jgi:CRISPR-associated protein Cst1
MSLYTWTGNPFVDAGISAMMAWFRKKRPEDITIDEARELSGTLVNVYLTQAWKKNLFSVFPNNPVTNPSVKNKRTQLKHLLDQLISGFQLMGEQGDCIACGRRTSINPKNRMHVPMSGYAGSHFFPYKAEGADYCEVCAFAVQCLPLVLYRCRNLALVHSNSNKVMEYWAKKCVAAVQKQIASRRYEGCLNEKFINPMNALFHITQDMIISHEERWKEENATIRIYLFTNYLQGPDLRIFDLPSGVFRFLACVRQRPQFGYWQRVVHRGYVGKIGKKTEDEYKNYPNQVYQRLLSHHSILGYFVDSSSKIAIGDWSFLTTYLREVLKMDEKRIQTIRAIADQIAEFVKVSPKGKGRLGDLERASSYYEFANVLRRIERDRVAMKVPEPLITFDDYVHYLFPEGREGWWEVQLLILFRLYEVLHMWLIEAGVVKEEEGEQLVET